MSIRRLLILAGVFVVTLGAASPSAQMEQKIGARLPLSAVLTDEYGASAPLQELMRADSHPKPTLLVFAYYRCPNLCTLVLNGLTQAIRKMDLKIGHDYKVLTLSIDPNEKSALALMKKRTYLSKLVLHADAYADAESGWRFLTGTQSSIHELSSSVGFHYAWDPVSHEYAHPSGIIILTPEGQVSQYFAGIQFDSKELGNALRRASQNRLGVWAERLFLSCFHYDPATGKYSLQILSVIRVAGVVTALLLAALLVVLMKSNRRKVGSL